MLGLKHPTEHAVKNLSTGTRKSISQKKRSERRRKNVPTDNAKLWHQKYLCRHQKEIVQALKEVHKCVII